MHPPRPLLLLGTVALILSACSAPAPRHGAALDPPVPRPSFTLTSTDGTPYDFARATRGRLTFLFFGYTNCPDICPVTVANVAAVLHKLPFEDQQRATFVFVTTDPARDTLPALRAWLDHFDKGFVGLRGDITQIDSLMGTLGIPPSIRGPASGPKGQYEVGHAAVVLVFTADNLAHVLYPFGTRQIDWAEDIPRLLKVRAR